MTGEAAARKRRSREGRGWGPFSGGQLTIVIVAIAAMFAIPTAALAASGAFTSSSNAVPAVKGTNTGSAGIGVQGTGKKFGVLSNGPLGIAAGKSLSCTGCVGGRSTQLLQGQSESGMFSIDSSGSYLGEGITFNRPLATALSESHIIATSATSPVTHCTGPGHAEAGYLCLYVNSSSHVTATTGYGYSQSLGAVGRFGADLYWRNTAPGSDAWVFGTYTVSAP